MMKRKIIIPLLGMAILLGTTSCKDFLSTLPDNRIDNQERFNTPEDIHMLLTSAYPEFMPNLVAEYLSDNFAEIVELESSGFLYEEQVYNYNLITEDFNESPQNVWSDSYKVINVANDALHEIERLGGGKEFDSARAEAYLCRAFAHFNLVNLFTMGYRSAELAAKDLGLPYQTQVTEVLNPSYHRESVLDNFKHIEEDLERGLSLVSDTPFKARAKYHFNKRAAYAFATRFYLYYQKWDKVLEYANKTLGDNPKLRNYTEIAALPSSIEGLIPRTIAVAGVRQENNLFILPITSHLGNLFYRVSIGLRYQHSDFVADNETFYVDGPWVGGAFTSRQLKVYPVKMTPQRKAVVPKFPSFIDYSTGQVLIKTSDPEFTTDETLLSRAEAYILTEQYDKALADMNTWLTNYTKETKPITDASIESWGTRVAYTTPSVPTPRKHLNPHFSINERQEKYLQACLHLRRMETIHTGLRWFDVKRYGIEITRFKIESGKNVVPTDNFLGRDDLRRAVQIPASVIAAGFPANPRS